MIVRLRPPKISTFNLPDNKHIRLDLTGEAGEAIKNLTARDVTGKNDS